MSKLDKMHELLCEQYVKMLEAGTEDPRLLKEIREMLKDNGVTNNAEDSPALRRMAEEPIEMPEDFMPEIYREN